MNSVNIQTKTYILCRAGLKRAIRSHWRNRSRRTNKESVDYWTNKVKENIAAYRDFTKKQQCNQ
jgi:hypothetical protein